MMWLLLPMGGHGPGVTQHTEVRTGASSWPTHPLHGFCRAGPTTIPSDPAWGRRGYSWTQRDSNPHA